MKSIALDYITYGFKGSYHPVPSSDKAMIIVMGDTDGDIMNKAAWKYLNSLGISALSLSLITRKDEEGGIHSWPIERVRHAVEYLGNRENNRKVGILGISMQAVLALVSSSLIPEISMTLAFSPADFIPWGFRQGRLGRHHHAEWPSGTSTFSFGGNDLPYLESVYGSEEYYQHYLDEKKRWGEIHTESFFTEAEDRRGIPDEAYMRIENIKGDVILVGARDDSMWESCRYIERMEKRVSFSDFPYKIHALKYEYGTHLLMPEGMIKAVLPVGSSLVYSMYKSGKMHKRECRDARIDLDRELSTILKAW